MGLERWSATKKRENLTKKSEESVQVHLRKGGAQDQTLLVICQGRRQNFESGGANILVT